MTAPLTSDEKEEILVIYRRERRVDITAELVGRHRWTVTKVLRSAGIGSAQTRRYPRRSAYDLERIARDYEAGFTVKEIKQIWGCSHMTVRKACRMHGVSMRRTGPRRSS